MTYKISLDSLRKTASQRTLGYYESVVALGRVENGVLFLEDDVYAELRKKYSLNGTIPTLSAQASNFIRSAREAVANPKPVSVEERERRLSICNACEFLKDGKRCTKCGCTVSWKSRLEAWHCPISKW